MTEQLAIYFIFTVMLLLIAALSVGVGRAWQQRKFGDQLRAEYERGKRKGYEEGRKVLELGKKTPPIMGHGYASNRAKRSGH